MWTLKREPGGLPEYMTLEKDYNQGNSFAAFSPDPRVAFGFARREDVENFQRHFRHFIVGKASPWELNG